MKKTVYTETKLDATTGELTSSRWITKTVSSTEHFVKMYLQDMVNLNRLSNADFRVLYVFATYLEYNTNEFFLNQTRKEELVVLTNLKRNTINQVICRLVKKNLLLRTSNSTYQMNPKIFFNGDELARSKYLEVSYRYEICPEC